MKTKILLALAMIISFSFTAAYAQKPGSRQYQEERIRHGYRNGKISKAEARRLEQKRRDLTRDIHIAKCNDGRISKRERARIEREWRAMNRDIYRYKNNDRNRF